ncbi:unnamed protein product [Rhizoctonia solani]|uniref:Uncharacterized protein n=1 Tax=Rhizoctonia solani TaxID=456999 RepID=A0A8H3GJI3_9AGAM|nr:unnamed protein product [Rhizoctonia solani]
MMTSPIRATEALNEDDVMRLKDEMKGDGKPEMEVVDLTNDADEVEGSPPCGCRVRTLPRTPKPLETPQNYTLARSSQLKALFLLPQNTQ